MLTPSAQQWMAADNAAMAGGTAWASGSRRCDLSPSTFGASTTPALPVQGNTKLQSTIAESFAYQNLPSVWHAAIAGTPAQVVRALVNALSAGKATYTLAIITADGTGGLRRRDRPVGHG